jgi:hypothetical protein
LPRLDDFFDVHPSTAEYIRSPSTDWDPVRSYLQEPAQFQSKHMVLSASWPTGTILEGGTTSSSKNNDDNDNNNQQTMARTMSIQVPLLESPNQLAEVVKGKLVFLMLLLHHVFFQGAKGEDYAQCDNISSAAAVFKLAMLDESFLTQAIVALGSGQLIKTILPEQGESNSYHKSSFLAFWAATELMR